MKKKLKKIKKEQNGHTGKRPYFRKKRRGDGLVACPECGAHLEAYQAVYRMLHK